MNSISKKKVRFEISEKLSEYLGNFERRVVLPFRYPELLRYNFIDKWSRKIIA